MGNRGGTTAITWIRRDDTLEEGLIYGTHAGHLVFCRLNEQKVEETECLILNQPSEMTSITYDSATNRLLATNRFGTVALFGIDPTTMRVVNDYWARCIKASIPRAAGFNTQRQIVVFGIHDARFLLELGKGDLIGTPDTHGILIGHVTWDGTKSVYCVDTILGGAALYRSSDNAKIQEFIVPRRKEQAFPKQVAFAEGDKVIISGSDHGLVYVFDRRTGRHIQVLETGTDSWVQSVAATSVTGTSTIFAGQALPGEGDNKIFVFKRAGIREVTTGILGRIVAHLKLIGQVIVLLAAMTAVYQNFLWRFFLLSHYIRVE
ncbi:hypothetical protein VNI00_018057 [Paramarasmius palmivorus]|uniref:Uncharacterized protein n=1 Tax=Paramarasmius palmivorus TaxID=297713 RepID=A0AAW0B3Q4_9AGAR